LGAWDRYFVFHIISSKGETDSNRASLKPGLPLWLAISGDCFSVANRPAVSLASAPSPTLPDSSGRALLANSGWSSLRPAAASSASITASPDATHAPDGAALTRKGLLPRVTKLMGDFGPALPSGPSMIQTFLAAVTWFHPDSLTELPFLAQLRNDQRPARAFLGSSPHRRANPPPNNPARIAMDISEFFISLLVDLSARRGSVVPDLLMAIKGAFGLGAR
jgi:hypothetical protein